jgi:hypothetical protein
VLAYSTHIRPFDECSSFSNVTLAQVFAGYRSISNAKQWCYENFVNHRSLLKVMILTLTLLLFRTLLSYFPYWFCKRHFPYYPTYLAHRAHSTNPTAFIKPENLTNYSYPCVKVDKIRAQLANLLSTFTEGILHRLESTHAQRAQVDRAWHTHAQHTRTTRMHLLQGMRARLYTRSSRAVRGSKSG